MRATILASLSLAFVFLPGSARPQAVTLPEPTAGRAQEIIIYRDRNFQGPAVAITRAERNLGLAWTVSSARVRGGVWQLCERPNSQGPCLTLSSSESNLGRRRVQSANPVGWRELGRTNVIRIGWINTVIDTREHPAVTELRLCAEQTRIRLHHARARFTNNHWQTLQLPSQLESGTCTVPLTLTGVRRDLRSVEVTASSVGVARGRIRLEGR